MTRLVAFLVGWCLLVTLVHGEEKPKLSAEDQKYLSGLLGQVVFDPLVDGKQAQRITFPRIFRSAWGSSGEGTAEGWLVPTKPGRVYLLDGESIAAPPQEKITHVDYLSVCKTHFLPEPKPDPNRSETRRFGFGAMRRTAAGLADEDLAHAVWLHRLGQDELAAEALRRAREDARADPRELLLESLAWHYFAGLVHAYMVRADEEALQSGEVYLRRYAPTKEEKEQQTPEKKQARGRDYPQAQEIVAELKRRQEKGTFGKEPGEGVPPGFNDWDVQKRIAYWIDQLEEVDARQWGQPGGVDLAGDARVQALIAIGEPAVPALIDTLEKDKRLTRSMHFWRDFARSRTVLSVREAALTAVMSIIRVRVFAPASTGDNFTARGEDQAQEVVAQLRKYWEENGKIPFAERMMKVLTNPKSSLEANLEAARNIATAGETHPLGTTIEAGLPGSKVDVEVKKSLEKFTNPTPAEAIIKIMDRVAKDHQYDAEDRFLAALVRLQDQRVAAELVKRSELGTDLSARRKYAIASHELGASGPLTKLASEFAADKIKLPLSDGTGRLSENPASRELLTLVCAFIELKSPEAERALAAVANPQHSAHKLLGQALLERHHFEYRGLFGHPYFIPILRRMLDDATDLQGTYKVERDSLLVQSPRSMSSSSLPDFLKNIDKRKPEAKLRAHDQAADQLRNQVLGLPLYHPLLKDADERLVRLKAGLDRYGRRVRPIEAWEAEAIGASFWERNYIIDIPRLDRAATAEDVAAGRAIFHLEGRGKPAKVDLPKAGTPFPVPGHDDQSPFLILVQAEELPGGEVIYGAISADGPLRIAAKDLLSVKTPDQFVTDRKTQREGEARLREQLQPKLPQQQEED